MRARKQAVGHAGLVRERLSHPVPWRQDEHPLLFMHAEDVAGLVLGLVKSC